MDLALTLGLVAGLMHIIAFFIYFKQILKGTSVPNKTTWMLWAVIATLNCASYLFMSGDVIKTITAISGSVLCIGIFLFSLFRGKLSKLKKTDVIILIVGLIAVGFWWIFRNATYANLILQICFLISFVPTLKGVIENPKNEKGLPWFMWGVAYLIITIVVVLRWNNQYQDLAYPALSAVTHGGLGLFTLRKVKKE